MFVTARRKIQGRKCFPISRLKNSFVIISLFVYVSNYLESEMCSLETFATFFLRKRVVNSSRELFKKFYQSMIEYGDEKVKKAQKFIRRWIEVGGLKNEKQKNLLL